MVSYSVDMTSLGTFAPLTYYNVTFDVQRCGSTLRLLHTALTSDRSAMARILTRYLFCDSMGSIICIRSVSYQSVIVTVVRTEHSGPEGARLLQTVQLNARISVITALGGNVLRKICSSMRTVLTDVAVFYHDFVDQTLSMSRHHLRIGLEWRTADFS